jgi:hypothetical protein
MAMVELILALGLLLGASPATPPEHPYVWSAVSPDVAQFGVPETDDASLVVFCDRAEGLSIGGPLARDVAVGARVPLILSGRSFRVRRTAVASECDTMCFTMAVEADDPAIRALIAGRSLTIDQAGDRWTTPGQGAAPILLPLIKACGVARPR